MKQELEQILQDTIRNLQNKGDLPRDLPIHYQLERPRESQHGDFSSNIALSLAKSMQCKPRELAEKIVAALPASEYIKQVVIAGPGFINFYLTPEAWQQIVHEILIAKDTFGRSQVGAGEKIHIEFVSSNPTGPLHVGHGRGAAYGAAVASLLQAVGFNVHSEYYVNDGGRQMDILATSVWLRYLQVCGATFTFPSNGYRGDYIMAIANELVQRHAKTLYHTVTEVYQDIPPDEDAGGDKELHIDALIAKTKKLLGTELYGQVFDLTLDTILTDIREDLAAFGVHFQQWFSERSLLQSGAVESTIKKLKDSNHVYERDGALWFNSTAFGDDKDRVLIRENGQPTYFAVDAAYRQNIYERGFNKLINVLGADHHGYVPRIRAVIAAQGYDVEKLKVLIVQFAILYRGSEKVQMSTRSGSFVTLRELREEVGSDAARFFYVLRKCEQHMDFDLDLAKSQSNDNPVYYVQYAHARICSVLRQLAEKKLNWNQELGLQQLVRLTESHELILLRELNRYPETLEFAALQYEPHLLAHYLRDLAAAFHTYYNAHTFLVDDAELRNARIALVVATRVVLANGLKLLGVSAPELM